jgi:hypothetical protein
LEGRSNQKHNPISLDLLISCGFEMIDFGLLNAHLKYGRKSIHMQRKEIQIQSSVTIVLKMT